MIGHHGFKVKKRLSLGIFTHDLVMGCFITSSVTIIESIFTYSNDSNIGPTDNMKKYKADSQLQLF